MSKYEGLEGIDTDSREIYETSDTEEPLEVGTGVATTPAQRRGSITEEAINAEQSRLRFEKEKVFADAHVTDFSDRVDRVAGYETATVQETSQNKLHRLRRELAELEEQLQEEGDASGEAEVEKLKTMLAKVNLKTRSKPLIPTTDLHSSPSEEDATTEHLTLNEPAVVTSPEEVVILDKRISKLERLLGSDLDPDTTSLQSMINDLFRKFKLLSNDAGQLEQLSGAIDQVNAKFEKSIAMRRAQDLESDVPEETQVHELWRAFQKTRDVQQDLPLIIKRLETLADLHSRVASSVNSFEVVDEQIDTLSKDVESWEKSLGSLEKKLEEMNANFEKNKEEVMKRLAT